jgi:serine protease AprX
VSGLPSGASGTFSPNPTSSSSTLSVRTSSSTPAGTYTLTISGSSGGTTHSTKVTLGVR